MVSNDNCHVCLQTIDDEVVDYLQCQDIGCNALICNDCFERYLNYCIQESQPPNCIGKHCKEWYLLSNVNKHDHIPLYQRAILMCTLLNEGAVVDKRILSGKMLECLRRERREFVNSHFTKAIALVVRVAFAHKLKRIKNGSKKKLNNMDRRRCMNIICTGFLNKNLQCETCQSQFCEKCEQRIVPSTVHKCKAADVASISALKSSVSCPNCKTRIFRHTGCSSITCAVCQTHFNYNTGEVGGHGSQNAPITVVERSTLSSIFRDKVSPTILDALLLFESRKPKPPTKAPFLKTLVQIKKVQNTATTNNHGCMLKLCRQLETYKKRTYQLKRYYQIAQHLEILIRQSDRDESKVLALIQQQLV